MHVLHLVYEPHRSGISQHVIELARLLPDLRHSVILPAGLQGAREDLGAAGAEVHEVPMRSRFLPRTTWYSIPRLIRRLDADLLHLHALETGLFGSLAARLAGVRRVVFSPQTVEIRKRHLLPLYRRLLRLAGRNHAWIGVSRGQVEVLEEIASPGRVHLVPNGIPKLGPLPDRALARRRLGWPEAPFTVAFVGRLSVQKDPWTFVRSAIGLSEILLVLVGDGPLRDELEPAVRTLPHVRLQGYVEGLREVYAAADVICLPSRWEGLPYTLLGALAHGIPVIASRVDGNVDVVLDDVTGLLVHPGRPEELRSAILRLAADGELRERLGRAGREHVEANFSDEVIRRKLRRVYELVLAGR
jgi:glycosyltransferase involved in cell wall biosynthesis